MVVSCLGDAQPVIGVNNLHHRSHSAMYTTRSLLRLPSTCGVKKKTGDVRSRVCCFSAPDDYSELVQAWFLTSECRGNTEAIGTAVLGTFRTPFGNHKRLVRITSP
ncbi:hypothetical protein PIB30_042561 [Stylosanthes scabra]|uniref:Uncharacterized protein n=1 Tax=Stylosanthes scabra TaxID=79078 RepID=A0ABU6YE32_9FABA|nr:hypothetical protein [Stylosanthes scabra]